MGSIQRREQHPQAIHVLRLNAAGGPGVKESPKSFVPERLNHVPDDIVLRDTQQLI
jgi:hypothetical protein